MGLDGLEQAVNQRFLLTEKGGVWLARKPVRCSFAELQAFCQSSDWRVARKSHLALAHTPFNNEGYLKEGFFPFPWGRQRSPFSARRIFVERGVSVAGLFNGPAPENYWWVAYDEDLKNLCRFYSAGNTEVYSPFLKDRKMWIENEEVAHAILAIAATETEQQDDYLRSFSGNLEANEGFALQRPTTEKELEFIAPILEEMGKKLTADSGILWISPVSENTMFFGAGGGCSGCSRLGINTFRVFSEAVRMYHPNITVEMYPEIQDWDQEKLFESYEDLARQIAGEDKDLVQLI